jgi:hypothetical protein
MKSQRQNPPYRGGMKTAVRGLNCTPKVGHHQQKGVHFLCSGGDQRLTDTGGGEELYSLPDLFIINLFPILQYRNVFCVPTSLNLVQKMTDQAPILVL